MRSLALLPSLSLASKGNLYRKPLPGALSRLADPVYRQGCSDRVDLSNPAVPRFNQKGDTAAVLNAVKLLLTGQQTRFLELMRCSDALAGNRIEGYMSIYGNNR